jgi:hypothetical protein
MFSLILPFSASDRASETNGWLIFAPEKKELEITFNK